LTIDRRRQRDEGVVTWNRVTCTLNRRDRLEVHLPECRVCWRECVVEAEVGCPVSTADGNVLCQHTGLLPAATGNALQELHLNSLRIAAVRQADGNAPSLAGVCGLGHQIGRAHV